MYTAYAKFSKPKGQDHRFSLVKQAVEVVKIAPMQNAPKPAFLSSNVKKISGEGAQLSPQTPP